MGSGLATAADYVYVGVHEARNQPLARQVNLLDLGAFHNRLLLTDVEHLAAAHQNVPPTEVLGGEDFGVQQ